MSPSPEQKEQLRLAERDQDRIRETWELYTLCLSQGLKADIAMETAAEAAEVWQKWLDEQHLIEAPEMPGPLEKFTEMLTKLAPPSRITVATEAGAIDAEFIEPPPAPAALSNSNTPADTPAEQDEAKD